MRWKEKQVPLETEHKEEYCYSILELLYFIFLLSIFLDLILLLLLFLLVNKRYMTEVT